MDYNLDSMDAETLLLHIKQTSGGINNIQKAIDRHLEKTSESNEWLESEMLKYQTRLARAVKRDMDLGLSLEKKQTK